jgi:hypothetical protein
LTLLKQEQEEVRIDQFCLEKKEEKYSNHGFSFSSFSLVVEGFLKALQASIDRQKKERDGNKQ